MLVAFVRAFRRVYSASLATPAIGATALLLVLGRILIELERIRAVAESRKS